MIDALKKIVGSDFVADDKETLYAYSRDTSPESGFFADIIVRPKSTEEISEIVKLANKTKTPIWPRGAATSLVFMGIPLKSGGIVLDLTRMNNIIEIDEDSMSVTAETGITWGKLERELKEKGWYTGFIGPAPGIASTIGGAISVASVMYGSAKYGTSGDILLGLEVVLPTGEIIRTGSSALKKSFHHVRYGIGPDSSGLFCGDQGIFGIKTQFTFKIFPLPKVTRFLHYSYQELEDVLNAFHEMASLRIASDLAFADNKIGVGFLGKGKFPAYIKVEGPNEKIVDAEIELLCEINEKWHGKKEKEDPAKAILQDQLYTFFPMAGRMGNFGASCNKIPIKRTKQFHEFFKELLAEHDENIKKYKILPAWYSFVSQNAMDVLPTFALPVHDDEAFEFGRKLWRELIVKEIESQGSIHYWLGKVIGDVVADNYKENYYDFIKKMKQTLDPNNILNPTLLKL